MGTIRENKLKHKANQIARYAYGLFASGKGTGSLGISQGEFRTLGKTREEVFKGLTDKYYKRLLEAYPEESWNDEESKTLDKMELKDVANSLIDTKNPADLKKKMEFSAYKELIAPTEEGAKDWYQMDREQIGKAMKDRGFNPKNRNDVKQFFDKLSEHDINYNRGKIVEETMEGKYILPNYPSIIRKPVIIGNKLAMLMYPSLTNEAVKQTLTGEFDDAKMYRALGTDAVIGTAMGLVPGGASMVTNPLKMGAVDAGLEAIRQGANVLDDRDFEKSSVMASGIAAVTVPGIARGFHTFTKKGGGMYAKPIARGIAKGARGVDDPVIEERNALKQLLIDAREQSKASRRMTDKQRNMSNEFTDEEIEQAKAWGNAADRLRALGYHDMTKQYSVTKALQAAQDEYYDLKEIMQSMKPGTEGYDDVVQSFLKARDNVDALRKNYNLILNESELDAALLGGKGRTANQAGFVKSQGGSVKERPWIESVIGGNPSYFGEAKYREIMKTPNKKAIEQVLGIYDKPFKNPGKGKVPTPSVIEENEASKALRDKFFPAKAEATGQSSKKASYKVGLVLGHIANALGLRVEPNIQVNPLKPTEYDEKLKSWKNSEWFKGLPKEKKNAIEKVLKGE